MEAIPKSVDEILTDILRDVISDCYIHDGHIICPHSAISLARILIKTQFVPGYVPKIQGDPKIQEDPKIEKSYPTDPEEPVFRKLTPEEQAKRHQGRPPKNQIQIPSTGKTFTLGRKTT